MEPTTQSLLTFTRLGSTIVRFILTIHHDMQLNPPPPPSLGPDHFTDALYRSSDAADEAAAADGVASRDVDRRLRLPHGRP